jgi:glycosyltransferase involved in cell wall biosynthesis
MDALHLIRYPVKRSNLLSERRSHLRGLRKQLGELSKQGAPFDVLIYSDPVCAAGLLGAACFREVKRIYLFHSPIGREIELGLRSAADERSESVKGLLRPFVYRWYGAWATKAERAGLEQADLIVCLSRYMRGELLAAHPGLATPIAVVPGGVDTDRFRPSEDRISDRARFSTASDTTLLVTVRRLEPRMGLDNLVAALPMVIGNMNNLKLLIGGEGQERGALERQIARLGLGEQVRLLGRVPAEKLPRLYAAADLFVLPTRSLEGFGLVTLEALACGTPVAATPMGATPEWLAQLDPRMLAEDASAGSIAAAILRMLEVSRAEGEKLRSRCRSFAEQYCWSRIAEQFECEVCRLLETPASREEDRACLLR